ncbi:MAG TPA: hypothetical protein VNL97_01445 [Solirubrobacterales bacterium]|nr:hypothetical protein [Solirubrobacterales bacterium]
MPKLLAALLATVLAVAALAACGGGDSGTSEPSSTSASQPSTQNGGSGKKGNGQSREGKSSGKSQQAQGSDGSPGQSGDSGSTAAGKAVPALKVSGGGSSQVRTKGGDNSIQDFGEEGDESELREAAEALRAFYVARADEDWSAACSYLASTVARQFEQLASRAPQLKGAGCAGALQAFTRPLPPSVVRETSRIDAVSLRREGERAFLIYRGGEGTVYATLMQDEGGTWKVAGVAGTPLN